MLQGLFGYSYEFSGLVSGAYASHAQESGAYEERAGQEERAGGQEERAGGQLSQLAQVAAEKVFANPWLVGEHEVSAAFFEDILVAGSSDESELQVHALFSHKRERGRYEGDEATVFRFRLLAAGKAEDTASTFLYPVTEILQQKDSRYYVKLRFKAGLDAQSYFLHMQSLRADGHWHTKVVRTPLYHLPLRLSLIFLVDNSESMKRNDPLNQRITGILQTLQKPFFRKKLSKAAVIIFSDEAKVLVPPSRLANGDFAKKLRAAMKNLPLSQGKTDYADVFRKLYSMREASKKKAAQAKQHYAAILLSDGMPNYPYAAQHKRLSDFDMPIYTLALSKSLGAASVHFNDELLRKIAKDSKAVFFSSSASFLEKIYEQVLGTAWQRQAISNSLYVKQRYDSTELIKLAKHVILPSIHAPSIHAKRHSLARLSYKLSREENVSGKASQEKVLLKLFREQDDSLLFLPLKPGKYRLSMRIRSRNKRKRKSREYQDFYKQHFFSVEEDIAPYKHVDSLNFTLPPLAEKPMLSYDTFYLPIMARQSLSSVSFLLHKTKYENNCASKASLAGPSKAGLVLSLDGKASKEISKEKNFFAEENETGLFLKQAFWANIPAGERRSLALHISPLVFAKQMFSQYLADQQSMLEREEHAFAEASRVQLFACLELQSSQGHYLNPLTFREANSLERQYLDIKRDIQGFSAARWHAGENHLTLPKAKNNESVREWLSTLWFFGEMKPLKPLYLASSKASSLAFPLLSFFFLLLGLAFGFVASWLLYILFSIFRKEQRYKIFSIKY